ncbi:MAG: Holliday junction resolvase RuvX [Chlamydiae bacterium]|nr:Holliday junction resolvase RuvX [Chlamydiota bacterium]
MRRIAGIDFGLARIGIALSDEKKILASPFALIQTEANLQKTAQKIYKALIPHFPLDAIVIGLPLLLNGKDSPLSLKVREFAKILEDLCKTKVVLWDERLTSAEADRVMKEAKLKRKKRAKEIDLIAAILILQSYLNAKAKF